MRGTWQTTAGGPGPAVLAVVAVVAVIAAVEWVAARIWWVLGGTLVLAVLAVAAMLALIRWSDRRAAAVFTRPGRRDIPDLSEWEKELKG